MGTSEGGSGQGVMPAGPEGCYRPRDPMTEGAGRRWDYRALGNQVYTGCE